MHATGNFPVGVIECVLSYEYTCIWFRGGENWLGLCMPLGQPLSPGFQISNFVAKLCINIYHIKNY